MSDRDRGPAVVANGLRKTFRGGGGGVEAVAGVDLAVGRGQVFGFLGPNGAGKTTTLRMLTTLLPIDEGEAAVAGVDVRRDPSGVRRRIGYVGQLGGADLAATGRENLVLQGRLQGLTARAAAARAAELAELLELSEFVDRRAQTFSGGQRRRLEIAIGLMHRPDVLFLDEPTTGLDPQNRANLWEQVRMLKSSGTTVFLTTHYLDEADALADRLAIIDHGRIVAEGTPAELKRELSPTTIAIATDLANGQVAELCDAIAAQPRVRGARVDGPSIRVDADAGVDTLLALTGILQARNVPVHAISLSLPSLDDVFLARTGRSLRDAADVTTHAGAAR